jgi:prepilin-type N-terminal cleavage/methylation domain-containing protein
MDPESDGSNQLRLGATMTQPKQFANRRKAQRGFALIEVMISMAILTIGLCGVLAAFAASVASTETSQEDLIARHKALDAMESIYTARNSQQVPFSSINNISAGGIFKNNAQQLLCAGPDGLVGTADDVACTAPDTGAACPGGIECLVLPGPDGILGTPDDEVMSLSNFTRTITFNPVLLPSGETNANLIAVTIAVTYTEPGRYGLSRTYSVNGLISSYH